MRLFRKRPPKHEHRWGRYDVQYLALRSEGSTIPYGYETRVLLRCLECLDYSESPQIIPGHFRIQLSDGSWRTPPNRQRVEP